MNEAGDVALRLLQLSVRLASARQSDQDRYGHLFATLNARLAGARAVERELDRALARSFNALDYLRTDELGLSKIFSIRAARTVKDRSSWSSSSRWLVRLDGRPIVPFL